MFNISICLNCLIKHRDKKLMSYPQCTEVHKSLLSTLMFNRSSRQSLVAIVSGPSTRKTSTLSSISFLVNVFQSVEKKI